MSEGSLTGSNLEGHKVDFTFAKIRVDLNVKGMAAQK